MAYSYLVHATDVPFQGMKDESFHLVICSHFSCYCHRYLVKVNINNIVNIIKSSTVYIVLFINVT